MEKETIHVSEAEAVSDFKSLLARVQHGIKAVIEADGRAIAVLTPAPQRPGHLLSQSVALADAHGCPATLDGAFSSDLEDVINSHREPLAPPSWE